MIINTLEEVRCLLLRGLITSAAEKLKKLQDAGLWLSTDLINLLKQQAGK
jgi:hypothetical protein